MSCWVSALLLCITAGQSDEPQYQWSREDVTKRFQNAYDQLDRCARWCLFHGHFGNQVCCHIYCISIVTSIATLIQSIWHFTCVIGNSFLILFEFSVNDRRPVRVSLITFCRKIFSLSILLSLSDAPESDFYHILTYIISCCFSFLFPYHHK